jgi:hypothetical protein
MPGTKRFCIVLGVFLMLFTVIPAPFGVVLQGMLIGRVQSKMGQMFADGSLVADPQGLAALHAIDRGGSSAFDSSESAGSTAAIIVGWSAYNRVSGLALAVSVGTFLMGVLWLIVGIRIPSKLPGAAE